MSGARGPHVGVLRRTVVGETVEREPVACREIRERAGVHTGAVDGIDVEALSDQRVHEPGRLARASEHPDAELIGEVTPEVAHDHQADSLGVGGNARAVLGLPLDTRVREARVEQAALAHPHRVRRRGWRTAAQPHTGHGTEHRRATAVLGVDHHRGPLLAIDRTQHLELRRVLVGARQLVETDHFLVGGNHTVHGPPRPLVADVAEDTDVLDRRDVDVGDPRPVQDRRC